LAFCYVRLIAINHELRSDHKPPDGDSIRTWDMMPEQNANNLGAPIERTGEVAGAFEAEFNRLIEEIRNGSQDAAWDLLERVGPHVQRVVRHMLNKELRSKFDSMDFVQAVWASFFVNRNQIVSFTRPEQLVRFLVSMARNKVISENRRRILTEKYDVRRERSADQLGEKNFEAPTPFGSSPSQFAMARECWQQLLQNQPELSRQILLRKYMGEKNEEIAEKLGINRKTVTRVLGQILPRESA